MARPVLFIVVVRCQLVVIVSQLLALCMLCVYIRID